jgi:cycloeucalenol cycloisomerase
MYTLGSLFYAIYFFVSFPAFMAMDEGPVERWSLVRAAADALGACMLVTILLDAWRLGIGAIDGGAAPQAGLPWLRH